MQFRSTFQGIEGPVMFCRAHICQVHGRGHSRCSSSSSNGSSSSLSGSQTMCRRKQVHICNLQAGNDALYSIDSVTQAVYEENEYESTQQASSRKAWQTSVRSATGRRHHIIWQPELDPPALLNGVCVVLVGPKKPISCGTVARACSCFECEDLRVVSARCSHNTRSSRSVSKGAQYVLHKAQEHDSLSAALSDVDLSVAFTRWLPGQQHRSLPDIPSLLQHPVVQQMLHQSHSPEHQELTLSKQQQGSIVLHDQLPQWTSASASSCSSLGGSGEGSSDAGSSSEGSSENCSLGSSTIVQHGSPTRVALVFGREEFGLSDEEVAACDLACSISIGRLQESLSLSHAVSIVLAQFYQARLSSVAAAAAVPTAALPYTVQHISQLAAGYDSNSGIEH